MVEMYSQALVINGPRPEDAGALTRRSEDRRHGPDRRQTCAGAHDLHGRLEDKRQAIEQERREFVRRVTSRSSDDH